MSGRLASGARHFALAAAAAALGAACLAAPGSAAAAPAPSAPGPARVAAAPYQVLVFSKTAGFRHDSIPTAVAEIKTLGQQHGFGVTATEDATAISGQNLARYQAVVFVSTTGDFLTDAQQNALFAYVDGGGGFMGIHAAADAEYDTPAYRELVGAWFLSHPAIQQATVRTEDTSNPATGQFGPTWTVTDELYNYRADPRPDVHVLQTLDESTYTGGTMGADHPITWCHPQGKGRSFYTGLGHQIDMYANADFQQLLAGGIAYAAGQAPADCSPPEGGGGPVTVEGEAYTSASGVQPADHAGAGGGHTLGYIDNGDWAGYSSVSTAGATSFSARIASAGPGGTVRIRSGSQNGPVLGTLSVPTTGSWDTFTTVSTQLTGAGSGPLFLTFSGGAGSLFDIDSFSLS
ncbi:ThuA domain-containing protein [Streptomyces fuscigenes]|uniref:ThuA domain-containing protein n=1 Tax=Streptomyces fuscigenes TaxID=1528880 RepID=UPI0027E08475|nr:ThuA domain-containing protein [Streptomyces fuscigenes]